MQANVMINDSSGTWTAPKQVLLSTEAELKSMY